jgi:hypothetical protein
VRIAAPIVPGHADPASRSSVPAPATDDWREERRMRIQQPTHRRAGNRGPRSADVLGAAGLPRRRAPAIAVALLLASLAGGAAGQEAEEKDTATAAQEKADAPAATPAATPAAAREADRKEAAAREATAARKEAAREKSLLDGKSMPKDWRLETKMLPNDVTGRKAEQIVAKLLKPRSDSQADWIAPLEPLHHCGEPRLLPPRCVPPPPCHPAQPPHPYDLVGVAGESTAGPIYRGPCCPRTGTHDDGPLPRVHRAHDRLFDWFYMWK